MTPRRPLLLAAATLLAAPSLALASTHAELRPGTTLPAGQPAQLAIVVDGDAQPPATPRIDGARVRFTGQASQTSIVNGHASHETRFVYTLVPQQPGPLEIPAIAVATAAGTATTAPLHATVTDAGSGPAAAARASEPESDHAPAADARHAFLTVEVPTTSLVVGQAVPIKIHAWFRGGTSATLQGAPHVTSDAFTLSDLSDKPVQAQRELHGEPYLEATWTAVLSPAKPSTGKLVVELPVELAYRSAPQRAAHRSLRDVFGGDPFGGDPFADAFGDADPFADMDSLFDVGPMQQVETTLRATAGKLAVADVPTAGRPAGFTGAVGAFALTIDPIHEEPRVGEPMTLQVHVTGTGNFDRVAVAGLAEAPGYKTYGVKSTFTPTAGSTTTGTKTFTQTIVPTREGALQLPAIALPFYDPRAHAFSTASATPAALQVAAARGGGTVDPGLDASVRDPGMAPNRIERGSVRTSLVPVARRAWFAWLTAALAALTAVLAFIGLARRSPRIAQRRIARRTDREVTRAAAAMEHAVETRDRGAFFDAARRALQARLAATWHTTPEAITAHDVLVRLGDRGDAIRAVFEHADGIAYGGAVAPDSLDHWSSVIRGELATLENTP